MVRLIKLGKQAPPSPNGLGTGGHSSDRTFDATKGANIVFYIRREISYQNHISVVFNEESEELPQLGNSGRHLEGRNDLPMTHKLLKRGRYPIPSIDTVENVLLINRENSGCQEPILTGA